MLQGAEMDPECLLYAIPGCVSRRALVPALAAQLGCKSYYSWSEARQDLPLCAPG